MQRAQLKVFFNTPNPRLQGGPSTHLPLLEKELRKYVAVETFEYGRRKDVENILVKLLSRLKDFIVLQSKISQSPPHIIHHNTALDTVAIVRDAPLVWLAKKHNIPLFLKMHGSCNELYDDIQAPLKQLRDFNLKNATALGVLSEVEKNEYSNTWPFLKERVKVVKNIIKPCFHDVQRQESKAPTILFISRFIRDKGMFDILGAVPHVQKEHKDVKFIFIGSGPHAKEFDDTVRKHRYEDCVRRIDHIDNTETIEYYKAAWAFVFPTHRLQEGMPMVVAEAMATGVPVITTQTKFARSYLTAGEHCLFVEYNDARSIADCIVKLIEDDRLRAEMSNNNRELAKIFEADTVVKEFVSIYQEMLVSGGESAKSRMYCSGGG